jgi:hypothetical protein
VSNVWGIETLDRSIYPVTDILAGGRNSILYPDEYLKIREFTGTSAFDFTNPDRVTVDAQLRASAVNDGLGLIADYAQGTNANKMLWSRSDNRENLIITSDVVGSWTGNTGIGVASEVITANAGTAVHRAQQSTEVFRANLGVAGKEYRTIIEVTVGTHDWFWIGSNTDAQRGVRFNAQTGLIDAEFNITDSIVETVSAGRYRITLIYTLSSTGGINVNVVFGTSTIATAGTSFAAVGTETISVHKADIQSSSAEAVHITTTDHPQYAGVNGRRWLVLNGAQLMSSTSISSDIFAVGEKLIYIPLEASLLNVAQSIFRDNPNWWSVLLQSSGGTMSMTNFDSNYDNATVAITTNTPMIFRGRQSGGSIYGAIDIGAGFGTESTVVSGNTGNMTFNLQIGASSAGFHGKLGGVFTDNTGTPDTAFEQRLRSYYL